MYKTVEETAKDIGMPEHQILQYIYNGRMKAVHDGEQFLVNSRQFDTYHEQLERIKEILGMDLDDPDNRIVLQMAMRANGIK